MKYICLRIVYSNDVHKTPCQSLIGINGTLEYEPDYSAAVISDSYPDNLDLYIPLTKKQYEKLIEEVKMNEVTDTNYFAFYYEEDSFERMYDTILERNKKHQPQKIVVESNNPRQSKLEEIINNWRYRKWGRVTVTKKQ